MFPKQEKEETEILGSSNSHEKAAAGTILCFDLEVKTVSRSLFYIFQDVSGAL